ncbi:hypothetical protein DERF_007769 [Dermatophagoides farinae]|uniref:Uncharacterized protein n=1 Tax=Dermatophagoides farinae TaxID=6954 RepID=A0A922I043_DERFA|nr:hypothetical protein DERF_007769 [Dermatophagoides farinae]
MPSKKSATPIIKLIQPNNKQTSIFASIHKNKTKYRISDISLSQQRPRPPQLSTPNKLKRPIMNDSNSEKKSTFHFIIIMIIIAFGFSFEEKSLECMAG